MKRTSVVVGSVFGLGLSAVIGTQTVAQMPIYGPPAVYEQAAPGYAEVPIYNRSGRNQTRQLGAQGRGLGRQWSVQGRGVGRRLGMHGNGVGRTITPRSPSVGRTYRWLSPSSGQTARNRLPSMTVPQGIAVPQANSAAELAPQQLRDTRSRFRRSASDTLRWNGRQPAGYWNQPDSSGWGQPAADAGQSGVGQQAVPDGAAVPP